jgi:hypothetical protein
MYHELIACFSTPTGANIHGITSQSTRMAGLKGDACMSRATRIGNEHVRNSLLLLSGHFFTSFVNTPPSAARRDVHGRPGVPPARRCCIPDSGHSTPPTSLGTDATLRIVHLPHPLLPEFPTGQQPIPGMATYSCDLRQQRGDLALSPLAASSTCSFAPCLRRQPRNTLNG